MSLNVGQASCLSLSEVSTCVGRQEYVFAAAAQSVPGARPLGRFSSCMVPPPRNFTGSLEFIHGEAA